MRTLVAAALVAAVARGLLVVVTVRGNSMRPTYTDGDVLLAARVPLLRRGHAIVFAPPTNPPGAPPYRVKRLVALPGDPTPDWVRDRTPFVPAGHVVVRGDNLRSEDSSTYGYVQRAGVLAVVVRKLRAAR
ncbi:S26 family signal peptidase [Actinophytocola sp. NPDC049390]|uniref:S26 family signal peptidase n=1 Tax=Actinophytocola sp. NPDC049390 TaxID=3363894 RepID=UPI00379BCF5F